MKWNLFPAPVNAPVTKVKAWLPATPGVGIDRAQVDRVHPSVEIKNDIAFSAFSGIVDGIEDKSVVISSAGKLIASVSALQNIRSRLSAQNVVSCAAPKRVVGYAAGDLIVPVATIHDPDNRSVAPVKNVVVAAKADVTVDFAAIYNELDAVAFLQ